MTTAEMVVTGITDEQLEALVGGGWEDDRTSTPGWERWVLVGGEDGEQRQVRQGVFPSFVRSEWNAVFNPRESTWVDSLDEALKWCDDRAEAYEIAPLKGTATKQEDRFRRVVGQRLRAAAV